MSHSASTEFSSRWDSEGEYFVVVVVWIWSWLLEVCEFIQFIFRFVELYKMNKWYGILRNYKMEVNLQFRLVIFEEEKENKICI